MKLDIAAKQLEALGNATRLEVFRTLIQAGQTGLPVGDIQKRLGIPASTLSHHIAKLVQTDLIKQDRESRTLYCKANYSTMAQLMTFLMQNCCEADGGNSDCQQVCK